jgi:hypothetical protein
MRGNHETCERNPVGWFTYLDPRPYQEECQRYTEPYVTTLHGLTFAVIDSAEASDTVVKVDEAAQYARQFDFLAEIAPPESWLVTHRPVWGLLELQSGAAQVENADYEAATGGSLKGNYALVLSGHIHLAETLAFDDSTGRPPQLISGNAGTALDEALSGTPTAAELGDPSLTVAETFSAFGFMTMELEGETWTAVQRDVAGDPVFGCVLDLPEMICAPAE